MTTGSPICLIDWIWPTARNALFSERDALEGKITCTQARQAFIDAAKEAEIYVGQKHL